MIIKSQLRPENYLNRRLVQANEGELNYGLPCGSDIALIRGKINRQPYTGSL